MKGQRTNVQILWMVTPDDKNKIKIVQCAQTFSQHTNVEFFTTIESFKRRLLHNLRPKTFAVVFTASEKELIDLYFIQHLLSKISLVLLLPDTEPHIIAMGHRLHPFFMCSSDICVSDLIAILNNIINNGYAPEPNGLFRNSFESISPSNISEFSDNCWICAAA